MSSVKVREQIEDKMKEIQDKKNYGDRDAIWCNKIIANKYSSFQELRRGEKMIDSNVKHMEAKEKKE